MKNQHKKHPKCKRCGKCCKVQGVMVDLEEAKKIIDKYGGMVHNLHRDKDFPSGWVVQTAYKNSGCTWQKGKLCSVHKHRPHYCKEFPYEDGNLSWLVKQCPVYNKFFYNEKTT